METNSKYNLIIDKYSLDLNLSFKELYQNEIFLSIVRSLRLCWRNSNQVFVAGNGGSASIVSHFATDWNKGLFLSTSVQHKCFDLNSNSSLLTASANDLGWENALSNIFLMNYKYGDLLIIVSSSGESKNLIKLAQTAKQCGVKVIGLSGNGNSTLVKESDLYLTTNSNDTQVIEDSHSFFGHLVFKILSKVDE